MSERRACRLTGVDRTSVRYEGTRGDDTVLRGRLNELAAERRRFGYRRLHVLLKREGHAVNRKRIQRLYREEKLTVRRRGGRKRAMGTRRPILTPVAPNQRWSLDFLSEQLTDGRRFRILAVGGRLHPGMHGARRRHLSGLRIARELVDIVRRRKRPTMIVSDTSAASVSRRLWSTVCHRHFASRTPLVGYPT